MSGSLHTFQKSKSHPPSSFCVALTGGIASGKTTVSDLFAELGVPVIDTDCIARELVEPGKPALKQIEDELGSEFINPMKELDRQMLRSAIFSDPDLKSRLESILHPLIFEETLHQAQNIDSDYFILVVPLLIESTNYDWVDRILVIDISEKEQVERVIARDNVSRKEAEETLMAQASRGKRLQLADDVLSNRGSPQELKTLVAQLHERYQKIARGKSR